MLWEEGRRQSPDKRSRPPRSDSSRLGGPRDSSNREQQRTRKGSSRERGRVINTRSESKGQQRDRRNSNDSRVRDSKGRDIKVKENKSKGSEREEKDRQRLSRYAESQKYREKWERTDEDIKKQGRRPPKQSVDRRSGIKGDRYPRDRRSSSLENHREHSDLRSSSRDHQSSSNERRFSSSDRHSELRREIRRGRLHKRERQSSGERKGYRNRRNYSHERLADSRDSLGESPDHSWTSLEGSSSGASSNNVLDNPDDHLEREQRRYSLSPRRRTPEQQYSPVVRSPERHRYVDHHHSPIYHHSPERQRSSRSPQRRSRIRTPENRRAESGSRLGPLVTSEQLLSQKQRLRPVRPSALSDLTHMPEHSLNDISLILKTAMTKRRDAFDEELSGRDSFHSDVEWSDWH